MDFELSIRIGDRVYGGTATVKDVENAKDSEVVENAVRSALDRIYNEALKSIIGEITND